MAHCGCGGWVDQWWRTPPNLWHQIGHLQCTADVVTQSALSYPQHGRPRSLPEQRMVPQPAPLLPPLPEMLQQSHVGKTWHPADGAPKPKWCHNVPSCDLCAAETYVVPCPGCHFRFCGRCQRGGAEYGVRCMCAGKSCDVCGVLTFVECCPGCYLVFCFRCQQRRGYTYGEDCICGNAAT